MVCVNKERCIRDSVAVANKCEVVFVLHIPSHRGLFETIKSFFEFAYVIRMMGSTYSRGWMIHTSSQRDP